MNETPYGFKNWRSPTKGVLITRFNDSEACFEVDWEETRKRQVADFMATQAAEYLKKHPSGAWTQYFAKKKSYDSETPPPRAHDTRNITTESLKEDFERFVKEFGGKKR
jgi:hypothetical protein